MNASELVAALTVKLKRAGIDDARFEARCLAAHVLGIRTELLSPICEAPVSIEEEAFAEKVLRRRMRGEPLQYLLGEWEFMGLPFTVNPSVLIPRADTEVLCEFAIRLIREHGYNRVLDLCCGTGCIGISIAKKTGVQVTLADISDSCLKVARINSERNGVETDSVKTDLFSALQGKRYDLICCNPPYLTETDMAELQREVRFEPALALYGGADGLDFYRRISAAYSEHLCPNGTLLLEIGCTQAQDVCDLFQSDYVLKDYAGNPRVVVVGGI